MLALSSTLLKLSAPFGSPPEGGKRKSKRRYYPPGGLTECIPCSFSEFSISPEDPILRAAEASLRIRKDAAAAECSHDQARDLGGPCSGVAAETAGTVPSTPGPTQKTNEDHGTSSGPDDDIGVRYATRCTTFRGRSSADVLGFLDGDDSHGRSCSALPRFDRRLRSRSLSASPGKLSRSRSFATPQFRRPLSFISTNETKATPLTRKNSRVLRRHIWRPAVVVPGYQSRDNLGAQPSSSGALTFQSKAPSCDFPDICSPVTPAHLGRGLAPLASERLKQEMRDQGYLRADDGYPENGPSVFDHVRRTFTCCVLAPTGSTDGLRIDDTQRSSVPRRPFSDRPLGHRTGRMIALEMIENVQAQTPSLMSLVFRASDSGSENENVGVSLEFATAMEDEDESPSVMVTRTSSRDFQTQTVFYSCTDYATMSSWAAIPPATSSSRTHLTQLSSRGDESWATALTSPPRPQAASSAKSIQPLRRG